MCGVVVDELCGVVVDEVVLKVFCLVSKFVLL